MYIYLASLLLILRLQQRCLCFSGLSYGFLFLLGDGYLLLLKQNVFLSRNLRLQIPNQETLKYQHISMLQMKGSVI